MLDVTRGFENTERRSFALCLFFATLANLCLIGAAFGHKLHVSELWISRYQFFTFVFFTLFFAALVMSRARINKHDNSVVLYVLNIVVRALQVNAIVYLFLGALLFMVAFVE